MSAEINMEQVASQTVQQLGAQIAMLTLELNAQRAAIAALEKKLAGATSDADGALSHTE